MKATVDSDSCHCDLLLESDSGVGEDVSLWCWWVNNCTGQGNHCGTRLHGHYCTGSGFAVHSMAAPGSVGCYNWNAADLYHDCCNRLDCNIVPM